MKSCEVTDLPRDHGTQQHHSTLCSNHHQWQCPPPSHLHQHHNSITTCCHDPHAHYHACKNCEWPQTDTMWAQTMATYCLGFRVCFFFFIPFYKPTECTFSTFRIYRTNDENEGGHPSSKALMTMWGGTTMDDNNDNRKCTQKGPRDIDMSWAVSLFFFLSCLFFATLQGNTHAHKQLLVKWILFCATPAPTTMMQCHCHHQLLYLKEPSHLRLYPLFTHGSMCCPCVEFYCRLLLLFFNPWFTPFELRAELDRTVQNWFYAVLFSSQFSPGKTLKSLVQYWEKSAKNQTELNFGNPKNKVLWWWTCANNFVKSFEVEFECAKHHWG